MRVGCINKSSIILYQYLYLLYRWIHWWEIYIYKISIFLIQFILFFVLLYSSALISRTRYYPRFSILLRPLYSGTSILPRECWTTWNDNLSCIALRLRWKSSHRLPKLNKSQKVSQLPNLCQLLNFFCQTFSGALGRFYWGSTYIATGQFLLSIIQS